MDKKDYVKECDYIFLCSGMTQDDIKDKSKTVLIYEKPGYHKDNWFGVVFTDGHAKGVIATDINDAVNKYGFIFPERE